MTAETEQLQEVFIGRQPVLDRQQATVGYELLFRPGPQNRADIDSPTRATADVVCSAFAELGLSAALASQQAFINVGEDFLLDDAVELLPPQQVVLEIESVHDFSAPFLRRCRELGGKGYSFCLHWAGEAGEGLAPLLDMLSYVKIDANPAMAATYKALSTALRGSRVRMIAGRVETAENRQHCAKLGFDLFQGYHFARPVVIEGRKLDPSTQGLIAIINLLGGEDADLAAVEAAFKGEPALLANLLRLTNSVGVGGALSSRITSVRSAIAVLGQRQLLRWLQLLLFSRPGTPIGRNPLMLLAALRGRLMELVAGRLHPTRRDLQDLAFITGLMSLIPAALGLPMTEVLAHIAVAPDARRALSRREGELGQLLELIERYDDNDMNATAGLLGRRGNLNLSSLGALLAEAIAWVQQLGAGGE
ncbi:MAG: EAL domain-containing protein [Rhodocyclaceae bacterium]|jgi:c-di-GMP-related signal transduction protein|nr:Cyclic di-GMP phosphodiesterase CdgJ [Rhodocyclaceae bacterium]MBZ0144525.1 EAL domain-containing protein [Rhodocyclaceae bacterium]MCC6879869.1 EAL domain-containing protein [Rhodocyclaceae bacterium]MCL4682699.1 EAL domain-containing protein [Rhodocyclaceae bacterium]